MHKQHLESEGTAAEDSLCSHEHTRISSSARVFAWFHSRRSLFTLSASVDESVTAAGQASRGVKVEDADFGQRWSPSVWKSNDCCPLVKLTPHRQRRTAVPTGRRLPRLLSSKLSVYLRLCTAGLVSQPRARFVWHGLLNGARSCQLRGRTRDWMSVWERRRQRAEAPATNEKSQSSELGTWAIVAEADSHGGFSRLVRGTRQVCEEQRDLKAVENVGDEL